MTVGDRDSQRVGGVVRLRSVFEPKQDANHFLHLLLVGLTVSCDCVLDLGWGVLEYVDTCLGRGQQGDAPRLPDSDCGGHVPGEKELLDRHRIGAMGFEQLLNALINVFEPERGGAILHAGFDDAEIDEDRFISRFDHAVAESGGAGIDSDYTHRPTLSRSLDLCHYVVGDVQVGVDGLDIVEIVEALDQANRLERVIG